MSAAYRLVNTMNGTYKKNITTIPIRLPMTGINEKTFVIIPKRTLMIAMITRAKTYLIPAYPADLCTDL